MWLIIHFFKLLYMLKQVFQDVSVWTQLRLHLCHLFPSQIENSSVRLESYKFIVSKGSVCDTVLKVKTCSAQVKMYVIHVCVFRVQLWQFCGTNMGLKIDLGDVLAC